MDWLTILKPILYAIIAAVSTIAGVYIKKLGTQAVAYIKTKIDTQTYDQALTVAEGLYIYLEDKYGSSFKKMGLQKKQEMEDLLLERFPMLTQTELDAINKLVWLNFQEGYDGSYINQSQENITE